ncbi:DUF6588 family protein [Salegentibacter salarius]|uniref:Outer membrane protein beta-barrel domain-containing protein n=1 Tax=Salegentibacter salarius TaxID=435906 RepID=A0A2N0U0Q0_9FLAO|nr:DUF6588 family protein [Salegentibacter salarius]PKD20585.1 hypothetical protein APR40_08820 [Salegentibacter salarius]SLJ95831.1 hypothetical protein SAMN05660445_01797 [Salegentibacter salarius]
MKFQAKYLILFILFSVNSYAQEDDLTKFANEMLYIADEFAGPAAEGAAYQAGAGWFTSATALKPWKVEISFQGNALIVPSNRQSFTISNNDLAGVHENGGAILSIEGEGSNAVVPTAFGGETDTYFVGDIDYLGNTVPIRFQAIEGINKSVLAYPFVQATVGLPFETEFSARILPQLTVDGVAFTTYGAALKHNFTQYFRFNNEDDFQASAMVAFSQFDVEYEFIDPVNLSSDGSSFGNLTLVNVNSNLWMASVLGSKKYGDDFEVFGALGATNSNFSYAMGGSGIALSPINNALRGLDQSQAQFKADLGFNIYFNRFKISTMATAGKFFHINAGLHFRI